MWVRQKYNVSLEDLLTPTRIYVNETLTLIESHTISGIAHITGGGLEENIERILPENCHINIDFSRIPTPDIFNHIQDAGNIDPQEMRRVFNMGIGMVYISDENLENTLPELIPIGQVIGKWPP